MTPPRCTHPPQRRRTERGSASIELLGLLPLMLFAVLVVVQACLALAAVNSADAAARAGARALSHGDSTSAAAQASRDATTPWLRADGSFAVEPGEVAVVRVRVPALVPALNVHLFDITRRAWLPGN